MRRNSLTQKILLMTVVCALAACDRLPVYTHFEHTPISGWEKNDTLNFDVCPVKEAGDYREELAIRINESYPFRGLSLIVQQTILPSGYRHNDTINCNLFDKKGNKNGDGINYFQYAFHINTIRLTEGDSLHIQVRHNMKREIMPGVADIGIRIEKQ